MVKTIILLGEPRSTGGIYKVTTWGGIPRTYMTDFGKNLKQSYFIQALNQWKQKTLVGEVKINIRLYFGNKRKNDWDNFHKLSMDALTGVVWVDDSQIMEAHVYKSYDKQNPRIEIDIL